ncbi:MAG: type IX secretion system protein PorQ [Prevotella sp.]|nr:type IX secretion system protein PorQ [Prevotella sp.]
MKKCIFICLLSFFSTLSMAQNDSQTSYNFLRLPLSAHAAALGGDNITMTDDDVMMMFHNPALITGTSVGTLGLQYMNYMSGCNNVSAAYNMLVKEKWNIGIGIDYMGYGSIRHTDADNNDMGTYNASEMAFYGTLGYELASNLAGGISLKYVYGNISSYNSMAVAVDLGLNYYLPESEWSFGIAVKNLGGQIMAYDEKFEALPLDVQAGVSKRLIGSPVRLSATLSDLNHLDYKFLNHLCLAAEFIISDEIYVGGGYNFRRADEMKVQEGTEGLSARGAGLSFGGGINLEKIKINLAYSKLHVSNASLIANLAYTF